MCKCDKDNYEEEGLRIIDGNEQFDFDIKTDGIVITKKAFDFDEFSGKGGIFANVKQHLIEGIKKMHTLKRRVGLFRMLDITRDEIVNLTTEDINSTTLFKKRILLPIQQGTGLLSYKKEDYLYTITPRVIIIYNEKVCSTCDCYSKTVKAEIERLKYFFTNETVKKIYELIGDNINTNAIDVCYYGEIYNLMVLSPKDPVGLTEEELCKLFDVKDTTMTTTLSKNKTRKNKKASKQTIVKLVIENNEEIEELEQVEQVEQVDSAVMEDQIEEITGEEEPQQYILVKKRIDIWFHYYLEQSVLEQNLCIQLLNDLYDENPKYYAFLQQTQFQSVKIIKGIHYDTNGVGLHFNIVFVDKQKQYSKPFHCYIQDSKIVGITYVVDILC